MPYPIKWSITSMYNGFNSCRKIKHAPMHDEAVDKFRLFLDRNWIPVRLLEDGLESWDTYKYCKEALEYADYEPTQIDCFEQNVITYLVFKSHNNKVEILEFKKRVNNHLPKSGGIEKYHKLNTVLCAGRIGASMIQLNALISKLK